MLRVGSLVRVLESHTRMEKMTVLNRLKIVVVQAKQKQVDKNHAQNQIKVDEG